MNILDDILDAISINNVDVVALYQFVSVQDNEALKLYRRYKLLKRLLSRERNNVELQRIANRNYGKLMAQLNLLYYIRARTDSLGFIISLESDLADHFN